MSEQLQYFIERDILTHIEFYDFKHLHFSLVQLCLAHRDWRNTVAADFDPVLSNDTAHKV